MRAGAPTALCHAVIGHTGRLPLRFEAFNLLLNLLRAVQEGEHAQGSRRAAVAFRSPALAHVLPHRAAPCPSRTSVSPVDRARRGSRQHT